MEMINCLCALKSIILTAILIRLSAINAENLSTEKIESSNQIISAEKTSKTSNNDSDKIQENLPVSKNLAIDVLQNIANSKLHKQLEAYIQNLAGTTLNVHDKKTSKPQEVFEPKNWFSQADKTKENLSVEQYKTTRIKESETAEKNLKRLLKVLVENMSFQSGGFPLNKTIDPDEDKGKKHEPQDDDDLYDLPYPRKPIHISNPKALLQNPQSIDVIEEILRKEFKKVIAIAPAKEVVDISSNSKKNAPNETHDGTIEEILKILKSKKSLELS